MGYRDREEEQLLPVLAQSVTRILRATLSLILSCHENCNKFKGSLSQRERPTVRHRNPLAVPIGHRKTVRACVRDVNKVSEE